MKLTLNCYFSTSHFSNSNLKPNLIFLLTLSMNLGSLYLVNSFRLRDVGEETTQDPFTTTKAFFN